MFFSTVCRFSTNTSLCRPMIVGVIVNNKQGLNGILEVVNPKRYIHTGRNWTAVLLVTTVLTCLLQITSFSFIVCTPIGHCSVAAWMNCSMAHLGFQREHTFFTLLKTNAVLLQWVPLISSDLLSIIVIKTTFKQTEIFKYLYSLL